MVELTRRRLLLGTAGAGAVGTGYWLASTDCPTPESPTWAFEGTDWSPPVRDGKFLLASEQYGYTLSPQSRIVCLDVRTGSPQWIDTAVDSGAGIPRVHEDTVFLGVGYGEIRALGLETGHRRWSFEADGAGEGTVGLFDRPIVTSGSVVTAATRKTEGDSYESLVVGLDRADGAVRWRTTVPGSANLPPAKSGDTAVVATADGAVSGIAAETGDQLWRETVPGSEPLRPLAGDDRVFVATGGDSPGVAGVGPDGVGWRRPLSGDPTALDRTDGGLLVGDETGELTAVTADGTVQWRTQLRERVGAVEVAEEFTWAVDQAGHLYRVDPQSGEVADRWFVAHNRDGDRCRWPLGPRVASGLAGRGEGVILTTRAHIWLFGGLAT